MKKFLPLILFTAFSYMSQAQVSFSLITAPCNHDGILSVTFTSGSLTPPLTVYWTTYGTSGSTITHSGVSGLTDDLTGYSGGPIQVSAIDAHGVTDSSYGYYVGAPPFICTLSVATAVCPAYDTISVSVSGGTAPYSYQWYNANTLVLEGTADSDALPQGSYGVTVTDSHGCKYGSMDDPSLIDSLSEIPPFYDSVATTTANCTNGSASVFPVSGGTPPFSYVWSDGAGTSSISSLVAGTYEVTVTDALGCSAAGYREVLQSIYISAPVTPTPATCADSDGAVIAFGSGGVPPYTYTWSNGATTQTQTGLPSGYYGVTVTDANGCTGSGAAYVNTSTPITVTYSATSSLCTGPTGTATVNPSGGTLPYYFEWYTWPVQTTATASALSPGDYSFRITDAVGCVQTGAAHVPPVDIMSIAYLVTDPVCTLSDGNITVYPTGGVLPYTYSWSTGATTSSVTGIPTGGYSVTITDALSCSVTKYYDLWSTSPVGIGLAVTPESCIFSDDGSLTATPYGGTPPYTYSWTGGGTTSTISHLPSGPYWVYVADAHGCTAWDSTHVPYDTASFCYCTIAGRVYFDINGNCLHDPGEPGIPNVQVHISGMGYTYTDDSGYYSMPAPSGSYTVTETVRAFYPLSTCQVNNIPVSVTATTGCVDSVNFANAIDTIHDMHISTWDYYHNAPVIGQPYTQVVLISNQGTMPEDSIFAIYNPDGQLLAPASVPAGIFNGAPYTYNTADSFHTLNPGFSQSFYMTYNVPTDIPLGTNVVFRDSVAYKAPVSNWLTDYSPWNNVNYFTTTAVGSYDPNFKEVYPKGTGPFGDITYADSILEYMVHFQNTGTYQAQNVVVIDTIDANLDWTSLSPEYMSAPCKVTLMPSGPKKVATFTFSNMDLPAEIYNPTGSNGMFTYTIHLLPGLPIGTQIHNSASIYFDYNSPVRTNTTVNTLESDTSSSTAAVKPTPVQGNSFIIYPNPTANTFNSVINSNTAGSADLTVTDLTGKALITKTITIRQGTNTFATDASQLAPGIYFVSLDQNGNVQTQKLVILKQ